MGIRRKLKDETHWMLVKRPGIGRLKALNCCTHRPMNPDSDEILHWNQYLCPWLQSVVKWSKGLLSILVIKFNLSYKQLIQSGKIELKLPKHGMTLREVDRWNIYSWWRNSEAEKEVLVIVLAPHSIRSKMDPNVFAPFFKISFEETSEFQIVINLLWPVQPCRRWGGWM